MLQLSFRATFIGLITNIFFLSVVQAQTPREIAQHAFPSVVVLVAENAKGKAVSLGGGFFVSNDVMVSNHHVIKGASRLYAKIVGQKKRQQQVRVNPKSAEAHFKLAETYRHRYRKTESIQSYRRAIRLKPDYAEAYYGLAESYMMGLFSKLVDPKESEKQAMMATEAYKRAIRIKPDYVEAHVGLGNVYSDLERYDEAIEAFKLALHIKPDAAEAYRGLGFVYKWTEQYSNAINTYTQLTRIDNKDHFAYEELGHIYTQMGEYDNAIKNYNKAISAKWSADGGTEYYGLWETYRVSGRLSEGAENFKQLIITAKKNLDSSDSTLMKIENTRNLAWAYLSLGIMYVYLRDKASALEQYKAIKALGNDGMVVSHANQLFDAIYK